MTKCLREAFLNEFVLYSDGTETPLKNILHCNVYIYLKFIGIYARRILNIKCTPSLRADSRRIL